MAEEGKPDAQLFQLLSGLLQQKHGFNLTNHNPVLRAQSNQPCAFSIKDEDIMMEDSYTVNKKPPIKEIALALALALLVTGTLGLVIGILMAYDHVGGDKAHCNLPYEPQP